MEAGTDAAASRSTAPLNAPHDWVLRLLKHLREGTTDMVPDITVLDPSIYTDRDIARREIEGVFGTVPFIVAHSSEIEKPGDYIVRSLPMNEAIITRGTDGRLRAFVNVCRHRGAQLLTDEAGHCRRFSCPYHGWSYDLDGTLRSISYSDSFGEIDMTTLGLVALPLEERHGFVWMIDNPAASIDVQRWLGPETDSVLATYGIEELVCFRSGIFDEPTNWKIMHDAFLDGYHIRFAHPNSAGRLIHSNTYVFEDYGSHCRFTSPRRSLDQWLEHDPSPDEPMLGHVMMAFYLGPNATLLQLEDNFQLLTFAPHTDDPSKSRMEMRLMVPRQANSPWTPEEWTRRWERNWHILQVVLTGEDFPILRSIQHASANRAATPTVLGRNEVLNQAFHREIGRLRDAVPPR